MVDKFRRIVRKYVEYILTKIKLIWEQRTYVSGDVRYKYIFKKYPDTDTLVVVLSACTREGLKARYNYLRTLDGLKCNRLYILDDFAADGRGSYYMGSDFRFQEEAAAKELIRTFIAAVNPKKLVFCGSSKGGYAALNLGLDFPEAYMVVGGPQYLLNSYLIKSGNLKTLDYIMGEKTAQKEEALNQYLQTKIINNQHIKSQKIYIHFSNQEHTYEEHIVYLLKDLEENGYVVEKDIASYKNHSDISYYFPDFLKQQVKKIIDLQAE